MRKLVTLVFGLMWAALLLGGAFRPEAPGADSEPQPYAGYPAPPLTGYDATGKPVALSDLRGKAVFVNFWASWCGPCRLEMPDIERLAANLPPGSAILTVNLDAEAEQAQQFLREQGYTFPVVYDRNGQGASDYKVISFPTSLFINPNGLVTARISSPLSFAAMNDYLKGAGR